MSQLYRLILGELKRLVAYKILPISLFTTFIWIIIFFFLKKEDALQMAPLLIFVDVTIMAILLIGASYHLEKQEGTIKSMMVMPVSLMQLLLSKVISTMILGIESALISSIALYFIHEITFNYLFLFIFIIIIGFAHSIIGYLLALYSKDFTTSLGLLMAYIFPFALPTILFTFGIIPLRYEYFLLISPSHSASYLMTSTITGNFSLLKVLISGLYLLILGIAMFNFVVYPKFKNNAVRG